MAVDGMVCDIEHWYFVLRTWQLLQVVLYILHAAQRL